jgi:hypothetical protein
MSTWVSRPADEPERLWHLEALLPPPRYLVFAACGLRWVPTEADPLERTEDLALISGAARCAACDAAYIRQITRP